MDSALEARKKTPLIPHALPEVHLGHLLETESTQQVNNTVLERAGITSSYNLPKQRRVRWLDLVSRMEDGRILKDFLDGELAAGKRPTRRHQLALQGPL